MVLFLVVHHWFFLLKPNDIYFSHFHMIYWLLISFLKINETLLKFIKNLLELNFNMKPVNFINLKGRLIFSVTSQVFLNMSVMLTQWLPLQINCGIAISLCRKNTSKRGKMSRWRVMTFGKMPSQFSTPGLPGISPAMWELLLSQP